MQKQVTPDVLLVTSRDAARMLAVSERTLWSLARDGSIPRIKVGASVRYDVDDLRKWVAAQKPRTKSTKGIAVMWQP